MLYRPPQPPRRRPSDFEFFLLVGISLAVICFSGAAVALIIKATGYGP